MTSKDKESKSFQDKFKQYFKMVKTGQGSFRNRADFALTTDSERELSSDTVIHKRLKALRDLHEGVSNNRLEDKAVEKIWLCLKDLIQPDQPKEIRHQVLAFFRSLIQGQYEQLTAMRSHFFRVIKELDNPEDNQARFELLQTLTDNGKDIKCFEEEIGKFVLDWMSSSMSPLIIEDFLRLIVNLIKFNASHLDEEIVSGFVNNACYLCCYSGMPEVVLLSLQILESIVSYAIFPHESLQIFVAALCTTVNTEQYCHTSWKIMRDMLGTALGHATLFVMCGALARGTNEAGLVRGAVFYINMALWGAKRVPTLKCTHTSVLPSFLKALDGDQLVVTFEVILAVQSLINKHGQELREAAWNLVFNILTKVISQIESTQINNVQTVSHLHETITAVEQLLELKQFHGNPDSLYDVIDRCGHSRPEASVMRLIAYRSAQASPLRHGWLGTLAQLVEKYCRHETRVSIRLHVLNTLQKIVQVNRHGYEEELLEVVVVPSLAQCCGEADAGMRAASARLLLQLARSAHSKGCADLLDILEKLLNRQFELYVTNEAISLPSDADISDVNTVVSGLIRIFHDKLFKLPSSYAIRVYLILVRHLELHYGKPSLFEHHPAVRMKILELFLSARANSFCHIGFCYDSSGNPIIGGARHKPSFSPYVCIEGSQATEGATGRAGNAHSPVTVGQPVYGQWNSSYVSIRKACKLIIVCLTKERDWLVVQAVLREIPNVMQNKALILSKNTNDIDQLASALCSMVSDKSISDNLRIPSGTKLTRSEFQSAVLPVLTCLAPYHANLDPQTQQKIIKCLIKFGVVSSGKSCQQCITALTVFTLEMRETMVKLLPEVLLELSKISHTIYIAGPILEFLSTLTRLPKVFASFVADQYMSVFAILLPYTNPSRYNHYIVSLAHHVIAAWFLKCRLSYRRDFVKFIIHGLHNNILVPFEEAKHKRPEFSINLNEDSSNRKRSSSLTEQGSRRREIPSRAALASAGGPELGGRRGASSSVAFHLELTETCVDLMSRYTFSPCSVKPRRLPTAEFMFNGGQSMTWLVGHKLVTITTSGCLQNALKQGLCDRCLVLCRQHAESAQSPQPLIPGFLNNSVDSSFADPRSNDGTASYEIKRYTKYTLQHSRSNETSSSSFSTDNSLQLPSAGSGPATSCRARARERDRQNSSENKSSSDSNGQPTSPKITSDGPDSQHSQLSLKLESLASKQSSSEESRPLQGLPSRLDRLLAAASAGGGAGGAVGGGGERPPCACWCSGWAEVLVRRPTGDVSWVMRVQNQMNFDSLSSESPLNDISALLAPSLQGVGGGGLPFMGLAGLLGLPVSSGSSGIGDSRNDILSDGDPRSRSGSTASQVRSSAPTPAQPELTKSSSDSIVETTERRAPTLNTQPILTNSRAHITTDPINIPGSPQRQNSSSTNTDDDEYQGTVLGEDQRGKSRHPVRRSNSSPEMSSSWKNPFHLRERIDAQEGKDDEAHQDEIEDRIPSLETSAISHHLQKKCSKNKEMRVSCEAIPEEMSGGSGTTPPSGVLPGHPMHPHLMTYNSDPGAIQLDFQAGQSGPQTSPHNITQVSSDTALNTLAQKQQYSKMSTDKSTQDPYKLSGKPPHSPSPAFSPAPPSPRMTVNRPQVMPTLIRDGSKMQELRQAMGTLGLTGPATGLGPGKGDKSAVVVVGSQHLISEDLPPLSRSKRSNTISVMSPTRKRRDNPSPKVREGARGGGGLTPSFVLLQLYHNMGVGGHPNPAITTGNTPNSSSSSPSSNSSGAGAGVGPWVEKPLLVSGMRHERSVKNLDLVPPVETYKVGVLYVGPGQHDNETNILKNEFGSLRYAEFLRDLGTLIALDDADKHGLFLNVEKGGKDGHFAYVWQDDIMQVQFHVATLMPNNPKDSTCNEKKKHIGNDFVSIVYNESGEDFQIHTIKGQFNFCIVIIEPLEHGINRVTVKTKDERIEREFLNQMDGKVISDQNVALLARQLALHCNLASLISRSLTTAEAVPYASNSLERLRIIKRLRARLIEERTSGGENALYANDTKRTNMDDFTDYT